MQDILIIGGGINGAAIAADAAGRGLKATLCEQDDLANYTSSYSSKLIHGGLRYLEQYQFKLVRESLTEREVLLKTAPHLVHPLEIVLPQYRYSRPAWMLKIGLWLYDHLGVKHSLPKSKKIHCTPSVNNPLISDIKTGFTYSDCQTDDARFVITNALRAKSKGARILTRYKVTRAQRFDTHWNVTVFNRNTHQTQTIQTKCLINAAGPWVDALQQEALHTDSPYHIELVQGSHMIFDKLYDGDQAYLLQHQDKRIIFVIPYLDDFTLIGTTDIPYEGDPAKAKISASEKAYLCDIVNQYFHSKISPDEAKWCFSGVRPLVFEKGKSASKVSRDYKIDLQRSPDQAPLLSIFGGKLTTHRCLAEHAVDLLKPIFPEMTDAWTANAPLPGGDILAGKNSASRDTKWADTEARPYDNLLSQIKTDFSWLSKTMQNRFAKAYGTRTYDLLRDCNNMADLGEQFGGTLYEREVKFLIDTEWAQTAEDILWRRTKQGLYLLPEQVEKLREWLTI